MRQRDLNDGEGEGDGTHAWATPLSTPYTLKASHGLAIALKTGDRLHIQNRMGNQVVDTWAVSTENPFEYSALDQTRSLNSSIFIEIGMRLFSNLRRPMLTLVEDTSPGRHDTLLCPCSAAIYKELGCEDYHRSCSDNFHEALASVGVSLPFTPASLNLFMNVPISGDGTVDRLPPASRAGDVVTFLADMPVYVILSACPQDITVINGIDRRPSDIGVIHQMAHVAL